MDINTDRVCDNCLRDWRGGVECPICGYVNEPEPIQPSQVTLCGLCDGARERFDAAVAFGRIVTVAPCDQHRLMGEGRF